MTRKQAIEELSILLNKYQDSVTGDALDVAIDALSADPCSDAISREAALDALRTMYDTHIVETEDGDEYINYNDTVYEIEQLPPVTPKQITGHWILLDNCSNAGYYCSECHKKVVKEGWSETVKIIKYCPNCGCKMVEPEERSGEAKP